MLLQILIVLASVTRLAFDIGSSDTDYRVGVVDGDQVEILYIGEKPIRFLRDVERSGTMIITDNVREELIAVIREAVDKARDLGATEYGAVGTEAMRLAKNHHDVLERIKKDTGIEVRLLSPRLEAIIGFVAASSKVDLPKRDLVVWDIGGGSQEMITLTPQGQYALAFSEVGAISFKQKVILELKKENPLAVDSPNPLTREEADAAIALAKASITPLPEPLSVQLKRPQICVVGIGAFSYLDAPLEDDCYQLSHLKSALNGLVDKTDEELGEGPYVGNFLTDLCLVIGYMEALGIETIRSVDVDLTDGLLLLPRYMHPLPSSKSES